MDQIRFLLTEIHDRRQTCGKSRQPTNANILDSLAAVLNNEIKQPHPYAFTEHELKLFDDKTNVFSMCGRGNRATPRTTDYLYRVVNKGHLPAFTRLRWRGFRKDPTLLWDTLLTRSNKGKDWLPLAEFADNHYPPGVVKAWFSCTWWTDFPLDPDVILGAYTIGLFTECISDQVYILRVPISAVQSLQAARVPTVVEAFLQPVFRPTREASADAGVTINLATYKHPVPGVGEFSLRRFPVTLIEIKPLPLDFAFRQRHAVISKNDPEVLQSLVHFYNTL